MSEIRYFNPTDYSEIKRNICGYGVKVMQWRDKPKLNLKSVLSCAKMCCVCTVYNCTFDA